MPCSPVRLSSQENAPFGIERIKPAPVRHYVNTWWATNVSSIWIRSSINYWRGKQERPYAERLADLYSDLCYHFTSTAVKASAELVFDDQRAQSAEKQVPRTHLGGKLAYQLERYVDPWVVVLRRIRPPHLLVDWSATPPATLRSKCRTGMGGIRSPMARTKLAYTMHHCICSQYSDIRASYHMCGNFFSATAQPSASGQLWFRKRLLSLVTNSLHPPFITPRYRHCGVLPISVLRK